MRVKRNCFFESMKMYYQVMMKVDFEVLSSLLSTLKLTQSPLQHTWGEIRIFSYLQVFFTPYEKYSTFSVQNNVLDLIYDTLKIEHTFSKEHRVKSLFQNKIFDQMHNTLTCLISRHTCLFISEKFETLPALIAPLLF